MKNHEIENQQSKIEKNSASESNNPMRSEVFQGNKSDMGKAFQSMESSKNNSASYELPQLTLVDISALAKGIDNHGYLVGGQENQLRSTIGHAAAESAMNDARMMHATNLTANPDPQEIHPEARKVSA